MHRGKLLLLTLALGSAPACGDGAPARPRSALLITLDTTRYDALTAFGGPPGASPNLDALAAEGLIYDRARTVASLTMPAHASILTGLVPLRHTVHTNSQLTLPESATTLAERARARGFQTAAFVAAVVLADEFGLDQGFDVYDQPKPPLVPTQRHYDRRPGAEVADAAIAWIDGLDPERPFLAWAHFFDPHLPFAPEQELLARVGGSAYHAEVAAMDRAIGRILDALKRRGLYDNTLIVVVADHGESQGEHGEDTHGTLAYDATVRVPLIVRAPDFEDGGGRGGGALRAGERSTEVVSVVDVMPTMVEALALGAAGDVDGISLYRRTAPDDRGVYVEAYYGFYSFGWSPIVGWADRDGKYLFSSAPEFYATESDPRETRNVVAELAPERLARYRAGIAGLAAREVLARGEDDATSAAVIEKLRGLGYTGASGDRDGLGLPQPLAESSLPSPASMQPAYRMLLAAGQLADAERFDEAIAVYRKVVAANPGNTDAWFQLGGTLVRVGRNEESLAASSEALARGSRWFGVLKNVGLAQQRLGRPAEALAAYDEALETAPLMLDVLTQCIALCEELGRDDEADRYRIRLIDARAAAAEDESRR